MANPQQNDIVTFTLHGRLDSGEEFFVADVDKPFTAKIGASELPPSVEQTLQQMSVGQTQKIRVPPEEGYGFRQKNLLQEIENPDIVARLNPRPGMIISLKTVKNGEEVQIPATVMEVQGNKITVDYNHPLAGHHLTYEMTLLKIEKAVQH